MSATQKPLRRTLNATPKWKCLIREFLQSFVDYTTLNWETFLPALALSYNTSFHSAIATTPFELLFGEKARQPLFPNEDIQQINYGETSVAERFNFLQKLRAKAHQFSTEQGQKSKDNFDKNTKAHNFKIGDKVLISNDFNKGKIRNWRHSSKAMVKLLTLMTLTLK